MKVFTWNDILASLNSGVEIPYFKNINTGFSIGSFDGLHKGHRKLLNLLVEKCKKENLSSGVVSFTRPLPSIKHSSDYKGDLSTLPQRLKLFEQLGIDFAVIVDFDDSFSSMLGADFLNILVNVCNMKLIAEGIDFRCGYKGSTDSQAIKYFAQKNNIQAFFMNPVYQMNSENIDSEIIEEDEENNERISSSYIRELILKGFFTTVNELLERKYEMEIPENELKNELKISKDRIKQVIPACGIYHCENESSKNVRVEITEKEISLSESSAKLFFG